MNKIKRFIDCYLPVTTCNFRCHYCYITQQKKFNDKLPDFKYSPEQIGRSLSQERMGGICCFNICGGGETLLPPETVEIIKKILEEGHYVMVVTNGSMTNRFKKIAKFPKDLLKRLLFKFSFHYLELKRMNLLDKFFNNVTMMKNAGCSFSIEITPNDELIEHIEDIKKVCKEKVFALPHITVARNSTKKELPILTNLSKKEYIKTWSQFNSDLFDFKISVFNKKRKEFCYAGDWTAYLHLGTGGLQQCYKGKFIQNIFDNPTSPISWCAIGCNCQESHCYNAHAWLCFGAIPEFDAPCYVNMRDRICDNGEHWVTSDYKKFLSSKLKESNDEYTSSKKSIINKKNKKCMKKNKLNKIYTEENTCNHKVFSIFGIKIKFRKKHK